MAGITKIAVDIILIAILVGGVGYSIFFATNTTGWDASTVLTWGFIGVIVAAALIINLLKDAGVKVQM